MTQTKKSLTPGSRLDILRGKQQKVASGFPHVNKKWPTLTTLASEEKKKRTMPPIYEIK